MRWPPWPLPRKDVLDQIFQFLGIVGIDTPVLFAGAVFELDRRFLGDVIKQLLLGIRRALVLRGDFLHRLT